MTTIFLSLKRLSDDGKVRGVFEARFMVYWRKYAGAFYTRALERNMMQRRVKAGAQELTYELTRARQKRVTLRVKEGSVYVRAPLRYPLKELDAFVVHHATAIDELLGQWQAQPKECDFSEEVLRIKQEAVLADASQRIPAAVRQFASLLGVEVGRITLKDQRTRWGSCSSKGNLNFNYRLALAPQEVLSYVALHEVCHLLEMNHSKAFWHLVGSVMPEYRAQRAWLKQNAHMLTLAYALAKEEIG